MSRKIDTTLTVIGLVHSQHLMVISTFSNGFAAEEANGMKVHVHWLLKPDNLK